jgi:hypothetical protein
VSFFLYTEYTADDNKSFNTRRTGQQVDIQASSTVSMSPVRTESSTEQLQDESNVMRQMLEEARMNTETEALRSTRVQLVPETIAGKAGDKLEEEDESWEDFGWETNTQVAIPPSLLEDVGGEWGDDFQEEWEEGWK